MKKVIIMMLLVVMGQVSYAQTNEMKFGYLSYESVLQTMPDYVKMQEGLATLRRQYEAEQQRVEEDFNRKYEEFLDGQASFPTTILQKRQSELQEMLNRNVAFKRESQQLLANAEAEAKIPVMNRLYEAIAKVGERRGFAFILNTDADATLWLNPSMGEDITDAVIQALR